MLQHIRDRAQSWISIAIIGLVILALSAFAWDALFSPDPIVAVAKINGEKIEADDFQRYYQEQRANLQARFSGIDINSLIPDEEQYKQDLLDQLVDQEVLWQAAQRQGYRIGDVWLGEEVRTLPFFQTDGRFDPALYEQLLRQYFQTPASFEEELRRERIIQQIGIGISETTWLASETQDALLALQNQLREVEYVVIEVADYADAVAVEEGDIQAYYDEHQSDYTAPEQVSIDYLELSVSQLLEGVAVDDEALQELYQERIGEFGVPEQRRPRHILIEVSADSDDEGWTQAEQRAEALIQRIDEGESFEALAKEHSDDIGSAQSGGDLGFLARDEMIDDIFAEAAFALSEDEVSAPVRSTYGIHIIQLAEIRPSTVKAFDEVRETLAVDYRRREAEEIYYEQSEILANAVFENPDSLEPAAERLGLTVQSTPLFSRDSGVGIAANRDLRDLAFSNDVLEIGNNSEPFELTADRLVALRVNEHRPAAVRPLDNVKAQVTDDFRHHQGKLEAQAVGQKIEEGLNATGEATEVLEQHGLAWQTPGEVTRDNRSVNREVVAQAFRMAHPADEQPTIGGVQLASGAYAVVIVRSVKPGDVATVEDARRDNMVMQQRLGLGRGELSATIEQLKESAKIIKYPENI